MKKLDILAFAAHPDDTELSCSGTLASHIAQGKKAGVIDFTRGEMGTRGTADQREQEALDSAKLLGLSLRENLGFEDALFEKDIIHLTSIVEKIRQFQPEIVFANAVHDRHPDHDRAANMVSEACFLSGLKKFKTEYDGEDQSPWRPGALFHYIQSLYIKPDIVVDISDHWQTKLNSIKTFKSQFFDPHNKEPQTFISAPGFLELMEARAREFGYVIGVEYAEGFTIDRYIGVKNLFNLI